MTPSTRLAALAAALLACTSPASVPAPPVLPPAVEPPPDLPEADVRVRPDAQPSSITVEAAERLELAGPIATSTIAVTVRNPDTSVGEARLDLQLPDGAVVGRLALEVDGRWMEGEILPRATARQLYEGIVRPAVGPRRDPALLVGLGAGRWSLDVFPVPPGGARQVELVYHRVIGAAPGTVRVEAAPPSLTGGGAVFAAVPRFDRAPAGAPPARVVVALDTSLSMGKDGLAAGIAIARRVLAAHPDARLVTGDLRVRACTAAFDACLARADAGGSTDLRALLEEAVRAAGAGPAAIVLVTDGRVSAAAADRVAAGLDGLVRGAKVAVHAVGAGRARPRMLARLAGVGLGAVATGETLDDVLRRPRLPRYEVAGADAVEVVATARGPVVLGRLAALGPRLEITRTDDAGTSRAPLDVGLEVARGFAVARALGAARVAWAGDDAAQVARDWGVASDDAGLLALETDDEYAARGIARFKAAERALELGQPPPMISEEARARDRRVIADGDGDTIPDADDLCPAEAETFNGIADQDGCPDRALVRIEAQQLRILEMIYFERGRAEIAARAFPILDEITAVMREYPMLQLVALEGHRDRAEPRGDLGRRRADAVRKALIARGVEARRLTSIDLGDRYPLTAGRTADERARNRRVELKILRASDYSDLAGLRAEEVAALYASGVPRWKLDGAVARAALARGDQAEASAALARALAATADLGEQLAIFPDDVARAFPSEHQAVVLRAAAAGVVPVDVDGAVDRYFDVVLRSPAPGSSASASSADAAALRGTAERWLSTLADPDVRRGASPHRLELSARVLAWLGDSEAAERRRSELDELAND